ncbi:aminotransferase A [Fictibacillus macauensis ZFHKF-1]|uniref:Aminotransferase n=1 Tax=Fictibacillus macauensis ZFHKF-1 TaxID=1196324 RepID=I8ALQ0_9BACL|nr:aminotransferase A [Fictibacillus macauensis]EIT86852.1 aminotransferase A [Fictibacillus macauensis ZFHKF-1]
MEHLINPFVKNIQISGIRTFYNLVSQYPNAISFTLGLPDFPTPKGIKDAAKKAIDEDYTTYSHNAGYLPLREAAAQFVERKYQLTYDPASEVIVTVGASEAIDISLRTILESGCEVILPAPVYPGYAPVIEMCGATPVYVDTTQHEFKLTASLIEQHLTENTRAVILPYPSNPTGCVLTEEELGAIAQLLSSKEIFVVSDEIYSELTYEQPHRSIASFPGMRDRTIVINGLSKSHAMTGWRIGLLFAPAAIAQHLLKVHQYNVSCTSTVSQMAALEALTTGIDDALVMRHEYHQRRDYVVGRLKDMGLHVENPGGAFYVFVSIADYNLTSLQFATTLLQEQEVAVIPGSAFSSYGEGFIRLSYAASFEQLREGLDRLQQFLSQHKKNK